MTVLKQGFNVDPLLQKQAACISTMTYNEYWQVIDAGLISEDDLITFKYEDQGVATLEDGLYVLEEKLDDEAEVAKLVRFRSRVHEGLEICRVQSLTKPPISFSNMTKPVPRPKNTKSA